MSISSLKICILFYVGVFFYLVVVFLGSFISNLVDIHLKSNWYGV